jgi:hypothetical protein
MADVKLGVFIEYVYICLKYTDYQETYRRVVLLLRHDLRR